MANVKFSLNPAFLEKVKVERTHAEAINKRLTMVSGTSVYPAMVEMPGNRVKPAQRKRNNP